MTALNKQALREAAEEATPGRWEYYPLNTSIEYNVDSMDEDQGSIVYVDSGDFTQKQTDLNGAFIAAANPATILALLDELEAAEERYEDMLRHARSFREAHDSASELIRKMERNKPTVKLPTTRLWDGKIACYEESEVVAMLERAGINIAAAAKGE
ncbi:ead/Ea22-like family protein [Enterobacter roggenkampii]|uniref:ead/Ea22-like family protein n=2 Tax=Enterobacter roggenkampii TaxID=1812935 RepID=UPI0015E98071|nr:ead/Ea22-like family protein [Enterobacter roggenkampii]EKY3982339.1 ead/Ea22-like family protein [Enterobacter roggenkampii]QMR80992.1 ead/Ea22-like family protein [Enterobacter roggenkampii]QMR81344.1 ead/Ea22-like family protein [Enterobacter roggenkampii]